MSSISQRLVRPEITRLTPYSSARREASGGEVFLNANESPWNNTLVEGVNRYPECQPTALRERYARYAGVKPEQVLITRGADEGIDLLIRTFFRPDINEYIAYCDPTYGMYGISAETNGACCLEIDWEDDYDLPNDLYYHTKGVCLIFICNPNNPTGTVVAPEKLIKLANRFTNNLLVVDEAYIEFCPEKTVVDALDQCENLIILRTLSKAFGLAGARCGFVLASETIIALLEKVIAPYPVPVPVAQLAEEALSTEGIARMQLQVGQLIERREALSLRLKNNSNIVRVLPSSTNFILFEMKDARRFYQALAEQGLFIRAYNHPLLENCLRISIGSQEDIERIEQVLEEFNG